MSAQKGNILLPIVSAIALIAIATAGYFYWQAQQNVNNMIIVDDSKMDQPPIATAAQTLTTQNETANWKTFSNSEFNFTFKYPSSWDLTSTIPQEYRNKMFGIDCVGKTILQSSTNPSTLLVVDPQLISPHVGFCWAQGIFSETGKRITAISPTKATYVTKWRGFKEGGEEEWKGDIIETTNFTNSGSAVGLALIHQDGKDAEAQDIFDQILSTFKFTK